MPSAFVLINVDTGTDEAVFQALTQIVNITEAHLIYGINDVVVKVEADSMPALKETITSHIRRIDKVRTTLTMIVMEP